MSLMSKIFGNTRKPEGVFGKMMVNGMNGGSHEKLARWGLQHITLTGNETVLDCGCGGGANVKRLLQKVPNGKVYGIDYSVVSVEKSKQVNEKDIAQSAVKLLKETLQSCRLRTNSLNLLQRLKRYTFGNRLKIASKR